MLSFRKPKSKKEKKLRKRRERILKADDLVPDEAAQADDAERYVVVFFSALKQNL